MADDDRKLCEALLMTTYDITKLPHGGYRSSEMTFINPDGPKAADRIHELSAELERVKAMAGEMAEALFMVEDGMLRQGDGRIGKTGWNITQLNKARPAIHSTLTRWREYEGKQ